MALVFLTFFVFAHCIEVFLVPHSHCDPGWLNTFEGYYEESVREIFGNILVLLTENSSRKIVWSETSYLQRWMSEAPQDEIDLFKSLVAEGRIELVNGGWVQNDEASPTFDMIIRQLETGHNYLREHFGVGKVKVAWQLDPFGLSAHNAAVLANFGYEYLVTNRIDVDFKAQLSSTNDLEFIWETAELGPTKEIFTHILFEHYSSPEFLQPQWTYCFFSGFKHCAELMEEYLNRVKTAYSTDNIMLLYGDDFAFKELRSAQNELADLENLISYMNQSALYQHINIKYATPSEYFEVVKQANPTLKRYQGDFFPLARVYEPRYWTGYFTTRPALKKAVYELHKLDRATEIALAFNSHEPFQAREASMMLHHDAITGTCKNFVVDDYMHRIGNETTKAVLAISQLLNKELAGSKTEVSLEPPYRVLFVYNSLNWPVTRVFTYKAETPFVQVMDWNNRLLVSQSVPTVSDFEIYYELTLPAFFFGTVFVKEHLEPCTGCSMQSALEEESELIRGNYTLAFTSEGYLKSIATDKVFELNQEFSIYSSGMAGAYTYGPFYFWNAKLTFDSFALYEGPVVSVAQSVWTRNTCNSETGVSTYRQTVTVDNQNNVYLKVSVYACSFEEVLVRFTNAGFDKSDLLYTSNSVDFRRRTAHSFNFMSSEGDTYPVPGGFALKHKDSFLTLIPQFSIGVSLASINSVELLLQRSPEYDDSLGLGEGVYDHSVIEHKFHLQLGHLERNQYYTALNEFRYSPLELYAAQVPGGFTLSPQPSGLQNEWQSGTAYQFGFNNPNVLVSSAVVKEDHVVLRLMNFSSQPLQYELSSPLLLGGYEDFTEGPSWASAGSFTFMFRMQSGLPVTFSGGEHPATLQTYRIPIPKTQWLGKAASIEDLSQPNVVKVQEVVPAEETRGVSFDENSDIQQVSQYQILEPVFLSDPVTAQELPEMNTLKTLEYFLLLLLSLSFVGGIVVFLCTKRCKPSHG